MAAQGLPKKGPITRSTTTVLIPSGENENDLLRWDNEAKQWVVLPAPGGEGEGESTGPWFLSVSVEGVMSWVGSEDCGGGA